MVTVLKGFGFGSLSLVKEDFIKENNVTQLGYPPLRINILNAISGVNFEDAYKGKIDAEVDDLQISYINITDFIANKQASGRAKDLGDIQALKRKPKKRRLNINVNNITATIRAIALSSRSIVNGKDTPKRIPKLEE